MEKEDKSVDQEMTELGLETCLLEGTLLLFLVQQN